MAQGGSHWLQHSGAVPAGTRVHLAAIRPCGHGLVPSWLWGVPSATWQLHALLSPCPGCGGMLQAVVPPADANTNITSDTNCSQWELGLLFSTDQRQGLAVETPWVLPLRVPA